MSAEPESTWSRGIGWLLERQIVALTLALLVIGAGVMVHPFEGAAGLVEQVFGEVPRAPVAVDAIPDIGENQQIVFTTWPGRSPRDVEDQITYPLTTQLLGLPGVRTVRSSSMFGFSSIYVIFEDDVEFYWSRSRILEKLAALPRGALPEGATPVLGPDATALGQVYWYTLEGRDPETGEVVGGWDLHELRRVQDWTVRQALQATPGVAEVASVGGYVTEYQIDVDPKTLEAYGVTLAQLAGAVREANRDVGARTLEVNRVEYVVRGVGKLESLSDVEETVVVERDGRPLRIGDLARVQLGPAERRGALDVNGAEAVGGVVVARHGENPVQVIEALRSRIARLEPALPERTLTDGRTSKITIVPFYDRSVVVRETLGTLSDALVQQVLITIVVVLVLLGNLRTSFVISSILPLSVLGTLVLMKLVGVTANVMSLAGIAIAIGTMVDMGIVLTESMFARVQEAAPGERVEAIRRGAAEVAPAVATSALTTVLSFLPVFGLTAAEGKLFGPLAYTKTFALLVALGLSLVVLPALATWVLRTPHISLPEPLATRTRWVMNGVAVVLVLGLLTDAWMPLGAGASWGLNAAFVAGASLSVLGVLWAFLTVYEPLLRWTLEHKWLFAALPAGLLVWGGVGFMELGEEFMPPFDEGQFLYMPTVMPHASIGQSLEQLRQLDAAIAQIPEVEEAVGKLGRAESALDPAPVSMFETVVTYKPEWRVEADGTRVRQWRDHIRSPQDIWIEVVAAAEQPGLTSAPKLMPIQTRIVMLQSGMRAPLGLKVQGPDLESLEAAGAALERALRSAPMVEQRTVFAERVVGKPYLELELRREELARYGLSVEDVQRTLRIALSGQALTSVTTGRERYDVRVRYDRGAREDPSSLERLLVPTRSGRSIPLGQIARVVYVKGPQVIKSEDTFLTSHVIFEGLGDTPELDVVESVRAHLDAARASGALELPRGASYDFAGSYENQVRSAERLAILVPLALLLIVLVLTLQFRRASTTGIVYTGVVVAISGGFILMWLYQQPWFLNVEVAGYALRDVLQIGPMNLSVAVWVGVIALVGIATDDGVVMATYLDQRFASSEPSSVDAIREAVVEAGLRRVRPCLMTTATTLLALLPVVTSTGRGSDVMIPMAIPVLGGMAVELVTLFVVPVLYCAREELALRLSTR